MNSSPARRVGVFGGAFDPPHRAHVELVRTALTQLRLDVLHVLPTGDAWHKTRTLSPQADRLAMTQLAFAQCPAVQIDDRELHRDGPTYTIDTLRELNLAYPLATLHLIIGADQAAALPNWHDWQALIGLATICVAGRPDSSGALIGFDIKNPTSALRGARFESLAMPPLAISSTNIRQRVNQGASEPEIAALVPPPVARYIANHHLYRPTA
ncbi:MAG: nicotinate-nucleotide adenylyltransferase [Burkholderiales bacterium]